jgi:tetratricopeptide (TPR) repeat protein
VRNDFAGAKRHLEHGLEANPKDTDLLEAKAEMELRLNRPMAALESLVAGHRLTGRSLPIIERALKVCQVVGTATTGIETIEAKVKEFARRGFVEEAKSALVEALGGHPIPAYWLLLADLSRIGGARGDRIDALKYALSLYPHDDGHYLAVQGELLGLGVAPNDLMSQGPPSISVRLREPGGAPAPGGQADERAERAARLCGEAQLCEAGGDREGAVGAYMAALELDPANMGIVHRVAEMHRAAGMLTKAQILYSKMAEGLCAASRPDLALQCLDRADELIPGSTRVVRLTLADELSRPPLLPRPRPGVATAELPDFEQGDFDGRGWGAEADGAAGAAPGLLAFQAVLDPAAAAPLATDETNDDTGAFAKVRTAEEIYGAFRGEVERLVGPDDFDTSYNLGIGYREMGLIGPAIEEFRKAMRDPRRRLECCSMIAMCEEARGDAAAAMEWLRRGAEDGGPHAPGGDAVVREMALLLERAKGGGA